jgi:hypothetical protein
MPHNGLLHLRVICSTCFGHFYVHHQELETICVLLPPMVCDALVAGCWSGALYLTSIYYVLFQSAFQIEKLTSNRKYMRREENQLDATEWFIALIICSTCFGHFYAHHQELEAICVLLPPMVCDALVAGCWRSGAGQLAMRSG